MKRIWIARGAVGLLLTCGLDAQPKSQQDLERLQGVWNIVALEADGQEVPAPMLTGARIAIQGDRFTSTGMGSEYEGTISIDASQTPRFQFQLHRRSRERQHVSRHL
jgi:uncharacterized protein (TIGR03067 family)